MTNPMVAQAEQIGRRRDRRPILKKPATAENT
jgi:hypothetical protein